MSGIQRRGSKLGFSKGEVDEIDATINRAWQGSVEEEVNRRLAARELIEVGKANMGQQQSGNGRNVRSLLLTSE